MAAFFDQGPWATFDSAVRLVHKGEATSLLTSVEDHAAVDDDGLPGDVVGVWARQERDDVGDVVGEAAHHTWSPIVESCESCYSRQVLTWAVNQTFS